MLVEDVMNEAETIGVSDTIADAAIKMRQAAVGCLVVLSEGAAVGLITERDVALGCPVDGHIPWECRVFRHMSIQTEHAEPGMDTESATILMMDTETDQLPVLEFGMICGIVSSEDISHATERESAYAVVH